MRQWWQRWRTVKVYLANKRTFCFKVLHLEHFYQFDFEDFPKFHWNCWQPMKTMLEQLPRIDWNSWLVWWWKWQFLIGPWIIHRSLFWFAPGSCSHKWWMPLSKASKSRNLNMTSLRVDHVKRNRSYDMTQQILANEQLKGSIKMFAWWTLGYNLYRTKL